MDFMNIFPEAKLLNLEISTFDHCPILLEMHKANTIIQAKKFRFEKAWLRESMCQQIIVKVWSSGMSRSFYGKLEECSEILTSWDREVTRSFKHRIYQCKRAIKLLKGIRHGNLIATLQAKQKKLSEVYAQQEIFWRQRSKQLWLREEDQNSKYFHASTKNKRTINQIRNRRNNNGHVVEWHNGLENVIIEYFSTLFKSLNTDWSEVVLGISNKITAGQNEVLLSPVSEAEVKKALFHMHPDKSAGAHGMTPWFLSKILGCDW